MLVETGVPGGIVYDFWGVEGVVTYFEGVYFRLSWAILAVLAVTPKERRFPSSITAERYRSCSSFVQDTSPFTEDNSSRSRDSINELASRW